MSGVYRAEDCIEYFPRRPEFCGRPCMSILFSVHGHPGPYLKDILKDRVLLDGAHDVVMADNGWSRTRWVLEVCSFCSTSASDDADEVCSGLDIIIHRRDWWSLALVAPRSRRRLRRALRYSSVTRQWDPLLLGRKAPGPLATCISATSASSP